jgi:hypothetical protein
MSYLLRVELPDIPGSLGRLASAIGEAGANIDAIEIVAKDPVGGFAIDDVFIAADGIMPDSIVSACTALDGVSVLWISRYAAGGNLFLDLEAVESMTQDPTTAVEKLVDAVPDVFRVDWGMHMVRDGDGAAIVHGTVSAPTEVPKGVRWPENLEKAQVIEVDEWVEIVVAASPLNADELVVVGRRGGPEFLDSEIARLAHLVAMAASLRRNA